jgi:putative ABC transport system substrate-binding protein
MHRIGFISPRVDKDRMLGRLVESLRELGYAEGRTILIEPRYAAGRREALPVIVQELTRLRLDAIVTLGRGATNAAKAVSSTLPVVFVTRYAEDGPIPPDGHVTGIRLMTAELGAARVRLVRDLLPTIRRLAILWDPVSTPRAYMQSAEVTATSLGLAPAVVVGHEPNDINAAFNTAVQQRAGAIIVLPSASFAFRHEWIVGRSARRHLPALYEDRDFVEAGGLMSYGPDLRQVSRQLATQVDRILRGMTPPSPAVEQLTKYELLINRGTANALGLTIPPALLARADQVIE